MKRTFMKRTDDDRIRLWHVCAGLALVAGMFRFGMVQSEPPRPEDARVDTIATSFTDSGAITPGDRETRGRTAGP